MPFYSSVRHTTQVPAKMGAEGTPRAIASKQKANKHNVSNNDDSKPLTKATSKTTHITTHRQARQASKQDRQAGTAQQASRQAQHNAYSHTHTHSTHHPTRVVTTQHKSPAATNDGHQHAELHGPLLVGQQQLALQKKIRGVGGAVGTHGEGIHWPGWQQQHWSAGHQE